MAKGGGQVSGESRLSDVAGIAGVSLRTASRVLNDDPRVAATTRERVQLAMRELSFQPNAMARSLRAGSDTTIGLIVESISDPFFAGLIDAVESAMSTHHRSVLVASTHRDPSAERTITTRMLQRRVAGLLLCPTGEDHSWLADQDVPVVLVDRDARRRERRSDCDRRPRRRVRRGDPSDSPRPPPDRLHR